MESTLPIEKVVFVLDVYELYKTCPVGVLHTWTRLYYGNRGWSSTRSVLVSTSSFICEFNQQLESPVTTGILPGTRWYIYIGYLSNGFNRFNPRCISVYFGGKAATPNREDRMAPWRQWRSFGKSWKPWWKSSRESWWRNSAIAHEALFFFFGFSRPKTKMSTPWKMVVVRFVRLLLFLKWPPFLGDMLVFNRCIFR